MSGSIVSNQAINSSVVLKGGKVKVSKNVWGGGGKSSWMQITLGLIKFQRGGDTIARG